MGIWRRTSASVEVAEAEELRKEIWRRIGGGGNARKPGPDGVRRRSEGIGGEWWEEDGRTVCVTGGVSFLGSAIVDRLLGRGFAVRLLVESQEDLDKLREMEMLQVDGLRPVMVDAMDVDSLCRAFDGCAGVFHTSTSLDPGGISGYSKHMADIEARTSERVIEACVRTESVRKCVFTSSLLACIWPQQSDRRRRPTDAVDESCWSDETICRDKKLWYALGKTMAERAAWRVAQGRGLKLVTVCPALVTGPGFHSRNSTASIAYLKGAHEMFARGLLATVDVATLAGAHISIYEAITSSNACGRYICYNHVIQGGDEIEELERQLGLYTRISGEAQNVRAPPAELSNRKLVRLMNPAGRRCTYDVYSHLT